MQKLTALQDSKMSQICTPNHNYSINSDISSDTPNDGLPLLPQFSSVTHAVPFPDYSQIMVSFSEKFCPSKSTIAASTNSKICNVHTSPTNTETPSIISTVSSNSTSRIPSNSPSVNRSLLVDCLDYKKSIISKISSYLSKEFNHFPTTFHNPSHKTKDSHKEHFEVSFVFCFAETMIVTADKSL